MTRAQIEAGPPSEIARTLLNVIAGDIFDSRLNGWNADYYGRPTVATPGVCKARVIRATYAMRGDAYYLADIDFDYAYRAVGPVSKMTFDETGVACAAIPRGATYARVIGQAGTVAFGMIQDAVEAARGSGPLQFRLSCFDPKACMGLQRKVLGSLRPLEIQTIGPCGDSQTDCFRVTIVGLSNGHSELEISGKTVTSPTSYPHIFVTRLKVTQVRFLTVSEAPS